MTTSTVPSPKGRLEHALGEQFRLVRRQQGVWLRDLSRTLGVSVNTIRWHEAGARMLRTDTLVRAAHLMGVQPTDLIKNVEQQAHGNSENA